MMTKKDMREADLPETDNPGQDSQTANAIRNQSSVEPDDYPADKKKTTSANDSNTSSGH